MIENTPTAAATADGLDGLDDSVDGVERAAGEIELKRRNLVGLRVSVLAGFIATGVSVVGALSGPTVTSC